MEYVSEYELGYAHEGDAGIDLRVSSAVSIKPHGTAMAGTGVRVAIPKGCVGLVYPRSGLASKRGVNLANCVGVIDSGYRGEIFVPLHNITDKTVVLEMGTRVCQIIIQPYIHVELERVDELDETERGADGFGSTGYE